MISSCGYDVSATGDERFVGTYSTVIDDRAEPAELGTDVEFTLPVIPTEPAVTAGEGLESAAGSAVRNHAPRSIWPRCRGVSAFEHPAERVAISRSGQPLERGAGTHPAARAFGRVAVVARCAAHSPNAEQPRFGVADFAFEIVDNGRATAATDRDAAPSGVRSNLTSASLTCPQPPR
jgi:hypothetical protein